MYGQLQTSSIIHKHIVTKQMAGLLFCLLSLTPFSALHAEENQPSSWKPIPLAQGLETPDSASVADGYVYVQDGHLHRDGERIRLWGVNCVSEFWRPKDLQLKILDRIQALGFNGIRVHLIDNTVIDPDGPGYTIVQYEKGDDSMMDRFDHFLAEAYKRDILVWVTLDRRRQAIMPEAYDLLPPGEDEAEWKAAITAFTEDIYPKFPSYYLEKLWPINPRLEAAYAEYVKNLLSHTNAYTGRTYAQEPGIGLWEISNEGGYFSYFAGGAIFEDLKEHPIWEKEAQRLWNEFLKEHYGSDDALRRAWGGLDEGESLEQGTVKLGPIPIPPVGATKTRENTNYPSHRISDLLTFAINRYVEANNRIWQAMRSLAPQGQGASVVPVTFDTHHEPDLQNLYCASQGSFASVGGYTWMRTYDRSDPLFPFTSLLSTAPSLYGMDMGTIADKPMVIYECNIQKPAPYRAEHPFLITANISLNDWDGFFWYHWMTSGQDTPENYAQLAGEPLSYSRSADQWGGVMLSTDELMISAIRIAGEMFKNGDIRPGSHPTLFRIGRRDLVDPDSDIGRHIDAIKLAGWTTGMAIEFDPTQESTTIIGNSPRTWHDEGVKMGRDAALVYGRKQLIIDSPTANAFIGWPTASTHTFESGLVIENLEPGKFVSVAVVSMDQQPLTTSDHLMLTALRGSDNTGFAYDVEASKSTGYKGMLEGVVEIGDAPVVFDRPRVTIQLPDKRSGTASLYNAFPEVFAAEEVSGTFRFDGERPTAWVEISYE